MPQQFPIPPGGAHGQSTQNRAADALRNLQQGTLDPNNAAANNLRNLQQGILDPNNQAANNLRMLQGKRQQQQQRAQAGALRGGAKKPGLIRRLFDKKGLARDETAKVDNIARLEEINEQLKSAFAASEGGAISPEAQALMEQQMEAIRLALGVE